MRTKPVYDSNTRNWDATEGRLTTKGTRQMAQFGVYLRKYYPSLPKEYSEDLIYVLSTDIDRCIESALCVLSTLYRPTRSMTWNSNIRWAPIPVHNVPLHYDHILPIMIPHCTKYVQAFAQLLKHDEDIQEIFKTNNATIGKFLEKIITMESKSEPLMWKFLALLTIRDNMIIDKRNNV